MGGRAVELCKAAVGYRLGRGVRPPLPGAGRRQNVDPARRFPFTVAVFLALFLLAPLPILVFEGSIPLARIFILAGVSIAVALSEGAGGPVGMITGLLVAHALAYCLLLYVAARLTARALRLLPTRAAVALLGLCAAIGVLAGLLFQPYVTPFGQQPRANLLEALEVGW